MWNYLLVYFKGILMGLADLVPGISGGTIAFITGIYERLIKGVRKITIPNYFNLLYNFISFRKKDLVKDIKKLDIFFLLFLSLGIITSIVLGSKLMSYLLKNYYVYLISFFIGLILASSFIIYKNINVHSTKNKFYGLIGFFLGLIFLILSPTKINDPNFLYSILGGFMAVFALFLPGISGSFILLIMGLYEHVIDIIKNLKAEYVKLVPYLIGGLVGMYVISRFIEFLFGKDREKTLYVLLGLVVGTLFIPIRNVIISISSYSLILIIDLIFLFVLGVLVVYFVEKFFDK